MRINPFSFQGNAPGHARRLTLLCSFLFPIVGMAQLQPSPDAVAAVHQPIQIIPQFSSLQNILIGPGDLVDVEVFDTPELSGRFRLDQLGQVTLPFGLSVRLQGMQVTAAAAAIAARLQQSQIMLQPSVMVSILEYATEGVTVLGEVHSPGIYTLLGPHSLYDALASAGGALSSEGSTITITHLNDADHPLIVPVTSSDYSAVLKMTTVEPGDTVVVSRAPLFYVVGDVVHGGAFYMQVGQRLTVINALALVQGYNRTAAMGHASIVRQTPTGVQAIRVNLNKIMKSQEVDPVLAAGDVLVIPRSGFKDFGYAALPGLTSSVANAVTTALIVN